jgi:hypothetical protein
VLLRFARAVPPKRAKAVTGALPGLTFRALAPVTPRVGCGEFVQGESAPDEAHGSPEAPAWRMTATLTKAKVDTFLFAIFDYPDTVDLSDADCLALQVWVPPDQDTSAELLVIVRDQDGGDYLASTGQGLGSPGRHEVFVPVSGFQLAGWSQDPDGKLDLRHVRAINIGWGGYLGREGEGLEFTLSPPSIGHVGR